MAESRHIDKTQIKLIHIAIAKLKISDEDYRRELLTRYFAASCTELSYDEATDFINHLKTRGFRIITRRREGNGTLRKRKEASQFPNITQLPSPEILRHIEHLRDDIRWFAHDRGLKFIQKYLKKDRPSTMKEAIRLVEVLKSMRERQQKAAQPDVECYKDGCIRGKGKVEW